MFANPLTERMAAFVRGIGIGVRESPLPAGTVIVDETRLAFPGDLLHEAGHIAVAPPEQQRAAPALSPVAGDELATLFWSYAAAHHLEFDPAVVFHADGYKGGSQALIDAFAGGGNIGLPLLQFYGMAADEKSAAARGVEPYPHMLRWLR